jgi:hypothetical protein
MINILSKKDIFQLVIMLLLIIAIPLSIILVQNTQVFKSRAYSSPILDALEFKDANDNIINCDASVSPPTCTTQTPDITVTIKNLDPLIPK